MIDLILTKLNLVFGFMVNQPLHLSLHKMQFVSVAAIVFSFYELHRMLTWYMNTVELNQTGDTAFFAFAGAFFAAIWAAIHNISKAYKSGE